MQNINGQLFAGYGIAGQDRPALESGETGMAETIEDFDSRRMDFLQTQKFLQQPMTEEEREWLGIEGRQRLERTVRPENAGIAGGKIDAGDSGDFFGHIPGNGKMTAFASRKTPKLRLPIVKGGGKPEHE